MDTEKIPRRFDFSRDSFAFANELVWEYHTDPATGKMVFQPRVPKPDYSHRCFVLTRVARQFFYHARFVPAQKIAEEAVYRKLIREILARNPRTPCLESNQVTFPGYANLREFSAAWEKTLKAECGGAWRSYVLRSHWRMVFPISRQHQITTAEELAAGLRQHIPAITHLVTFPKLTMNHSMLLFAAEEIPSGWEFFAYDPNDPAKPTRLTFDRVLQTFLLPPNLYWAGGKLDIIQIYQSWLM